MVSYRDIEKQDETPGRFETPGPPRSHAHAQSANRFGQDAGNMAAGSFPNRHADINVAVIYRFNRGKEGFNCIGSIKTDIYFTLGWVSLAASSISRYGDYISAATT